MPFGAAAAKASPVIRCCRSVVPFGAATARTPEPLDPVGALANGRRRRAPTADGVRQVRDVDGVRDLEITMLIWTPTSARQAGFLWQGGQMHIGVVYPQIELRGDPLAVRRIGRAVEDLGFDYLLAYDHVLGAVHAERTPPLPGPYTEQDPFTTRS